MKQFKLKDSEQSADNLLDALKQRTNRQSNIYRFIFIFIAFVVAAYIINALSISEYDGYISHRDIKMRAVAKMAIVDFYVKPGDIVKEGDTLYSQLMVDWLEDQVNPFSDNIVIEKRMESDLRIAKYESEIIEINNNIDSLKSAIKKIKKEIHSGIKTDDELMGLNLELSERIERSKHIKRAIGAEYDMQAKNNYNIFNTQSLITQSLSERRENLHKYGRALRYRVAYVDSHIINIKASVGMLTLEHEEVLTFQPIGHPNMTNSHINMIVDANKYEDIHEGMEVDIYAGGKFLCEATISLLGVRMADVYADMEALLDRQTDLNGKLVVPLKFKDGYNLPEKYYIHNYPVKIRYREWGDWSDKLNWSNWFNKSRVL